MPLEPREGGVERLEAGDTVRDDRPAIRDQPRQLARRLGAVARVAPRRDLRRVVERDVEAAEVDQQPQVLDVGLAVVAVVVVAAAPARGSQPERS